MSRGVRAPARCEYCGGPTHWYASLQEVTRGDSHRPGLKCDACEWWRRADEPPDDGRIRSPEDVPGRVLGSMERAAEDKRLNDLDRAVHGAYCDRALELSWVEVLASDEWVCGRLGLEPKSWRSRVQRSRKRLTELGYVRRSDVSKIKGRHVRAAVAAVRVEGRRPPTVIEVLRAPALPTCAHCGAEMPDALRASKLYCDAACRKAAGRHYAPEVEAALERALAGVSR